MVLKKYLRGSLEDFDFGTRNTEGMAKAALEYLSKKGKKPRI